MPPLSAPVRHPRIGILLAGFMCLAILSVALAAGPAAGAQSPEPSISQAALRLWPEYDDPGLLVIFSGSLSGTVSFPQQVAFPLPASAREIQATVQDAAGELLSQQWQNVGGKLTYSVSGPDFHVEYYLDKPPSGNQREVNYTFEAPYAIRSLQIEIQQPARASEFSVVPQPAASAVGTDGLTYYRISRTNLAAGDRIPITIRYTKSDQGLSAPRASTGSAASAAPAAAAAASQPGSWLPYLLIGLALAVLVGVAVYWYLTQRREARPTTARSRVSEARGKSASGAPTESAAFCTQCGQRFRLGDRFCANCGTPRKE